MNRRHFLQALLAGAGVSMVPIAAASALPPQPCRAFKPRPSLSQFQGAALQIHALPLDGLSERALAVARKKVPSTLLEVNEPVVPAVAGPFDEFGDATVIDEDFVRHAIPFCCFGKYCPNAPEAVAEFGSAAVRLFGRLVDAGVLAHGVLAAPSCVELFTSGGPRCFVFFIAFPSLEWLNVVHEYQGDLQTLDVPALRRHLLNQLAGNECFLDENQSHPTDDWAGLACKDHRPTEKALCGSCVHDEVALRGRWVQQTGRLLDIQIDHHSLWLPTTDTPTRCRASS